MCVIDVIYNMCVSKKILLVIYDDFNIENFIRNLIFKSLVSYNMVTIM